MWPVNFHPLPAGVDASVMSSIHCTQPKIENNDKIRKDWDFAMPLKTVKHLVQRTM